MRDNARPGLREALQHPRLLAAAAAAFALSTLFSAMKPVLLARFLEERDWSVSFAGLIVAAPFIGIAAASLLFYFRPPRMALAPLALRFGGLLVLLELSSAFLSQQGPVLLMLQLSAGFAVGALMAASARLVAVSAAPDASFGFIDMTAVALMSLMVAGAGIAVVQGGVRGAYLFAAVLALVYAGVIASYRESSQLAAHHDQTVPKLSLGLRPVATILMGLVFVTCSGLGFAFMFSMATALGWGYDEAGSRIGLLVFLSAMACQAGGWASGRFGPRYPLLLGFCACAAGWWLVGHAVTGAGFLLGLVPAIFALQFNFPILLALAGSLDEHGAWAAVAAPIITSGFAWAAVLAGLLVQYQGVTSLAPVTALGMGLCALLLFYVTPAGSRGGEHSLRELAS